MKRSILFLIPLLPSLSLLVRVHLLFQQDLLQSFSNAFHHFITQHFTNNQHHHQFPNPDTTESHDISSTLELQLFAYLLVASFGYCATDRLIPIIQTYTLKKHISGKDLGKRGTPLEDQQM